MKKAFFLLLICLSTTTSAFATVPATLSDYFAARFVTLKYQTAEYHIDFKEVQSVLIDTEGHISLELAPIDKGNWGKTASWIIFKNGRYILCSSSAIPAQKWKKYRDLLQANPKFLSIP